MTWNELINELLNKVRVKNIHDDVTVCIDGEYFKVTSLDKCDDGILDDGHVFLRVSDSEEGMCVL